MGYGQKPAGDKGCNRRQGDKNRTFVISHDITKVLRGINLTQVSSPQPLHCYGITAAYRHLIQCDQPFVSAE